MADYMLDHFLIRSSAYLHPHWQHIPLKDPKRGAKSGQILALLLKMHLMEAIFQINEGE